MTTPARAIDPEISRELAAAAEDCGCQLLEIEPRGHVLRLIVDRSEGVTLGDCEKVSRRASALLDIADFGSTRYVLEVSSPGLDRKLYGPEDYHRYTGRTVRITYRDPRDRAKRTVVGRLESFGSDAGGEVELALDAAPDRLVIALDTVEAARLVPEL